MRGISTIDSDTPREVPMICSNLSTSGQKTCMFIRQIIYIGTHFAHYTLGFHRDSSHGRHPLFRMPRTCSLPSLRLIISTCQRIKRWIQGLNLIGKPAHKNESPSKPSVTLKVNASNTCSSAQLKTPRRVTIVAHVLTLLSVLN